MNRRINSILCAGLWLLCAGCAESNHETATAPCDEKPDAYDKGYDLTYAHMVENALLADMSLSDNHFLPDRPRLSSLGVQRLSKLTALLKEYGGQIRLSTDESSDDLVAQRIDLIRSYLTDAGLPTTQEWVRRDLPGGHGMDAAQVILIRVNEGAYKVKKSSGGSSMGASGSSGQSGGGSTGGGSPY